MDRLAALFLRRRWAFGAAVGALSLVALAGAMRVRFADVPRAIYRGEGGEHARLAEVLEQFGDDDNDALVVLESDGWFTPEGARILRAVHAAAESVEGVSRVRSLASLPVFGGPEALGLVPRPLLPPPSAAREDFARARERALAHPLARGWLLSDDALTTLVVARLAGGALDVGELEERTRALRSAVDGAVAGSGARARITGLPAIRVDLFRVAQREQLLFMAFAGAAGFLVATLLFRRARPVAITLGASALGALWAVGGMGLAGEPFNIVNAMLPSLVMIIAFTDGVHLVIHVRRERSAGADPRGAAASAIRVLGLACLLTSATTAVGFGSLAVSDVEVIRRFGLACALGVGLAFVAVILVVPLASSVTRGPLAASRRAPKGERSGLGAALRVERAVIGRPRASSALAIAALGALAIPSATLEADTRIRSESPEGRESIEALHHCDRALGGILPIAVLAEGEPFRPLDARGLAVLAEVERLLEGVLGRGDPLSLRSLLAATAPDGEARAALADVVPEDVRARFLREDLGRALVHARLPDTGSASYRDDFAAIERGLADVAERHPGVALSLTGTGVVAVREIENLVVDLARGLGLAVLVIFGVIAVVHRSPRLGLLSIVPNALPLLVASAVLASTGTPLYVASAVGFTICLGIAVDDTIHLLARFRRELPGASSVREAVDRSLRAVSPAIVITTLVLCAGFAGPLLSSVPATRQFALVCELGFLTALVGDLLLLPALLVAFVPAARAGRGAAGATAGPRSEGLRPAGLREAEASGE